MNSPETARIYPELYHAQLLADLGKREEQKKRVHASLESVVALQRSIMDIPLFSPDTTGRAQWLNDDLRAEESSLISEQLSFELITANALWSRYKSAKAYWDNAESYQEQALSEARVAGFTINPMPSSDDLPKSREPRAPNIPNPRTDEGRSHYTFPPYNEFAM